MHGNHLQRPTKKVPVLLRTMSGESFEGYVFVAGDGNRVKDMLNTESSFVAFEHASGKVEIINKSTIARVKPLERESAKKAA